MVPTPLKISQLGWLFPINKTCSKFQTTNQIILTFFWINISILSDTIPCHMMPFFPIFCWFNPHNILSWLGLESLLLWGFLALVVKSLLGSSSEISGDITRVIRNKVYTTYRGLPLIPYTLKLVSLSALPSTQKICRFWWDFNKSMGFKKKNAGTKGLYSVMILIIFTDSIQHPIASNKKKPWFSPWEVGPSGGTMFSKWHHYFGEGIP